MHRFCVYLGGLANYTSRSDIKDYLRNYGTIIEIQLNGDHAEIVSFSINLNIQTHTVQPTVFLIQLDDILIYISLIMIYI